MINCLKYKWATLTNLIFFVSAAFQVLYQNYLLTASFCVLGISSFMYHYYTALYHGYLKYGSGWSKRLYKRMRQWQYADVSAIYLIFGIYPYELSGNVWWLLYLIPMGFFILNKYDVIYKNWAPNSLISIPVSGIPTAVLGFIYIDLVYMVIAMGMFVIAGIFSTIAEKDRDNKNYKGYDHKHGFWHKAAAIAFSLIG